MPFSEKQNEVYKTILTKQEETRASNNNLWASKLIESRSHSKMQLKVFHPSLGSPSHYHKLCPLCSSVSGFVWPQFNPSLWEKQPACISPLTWLSVWSYKSRCWLCEVDHGMNEIFPQKETEPFNLSSQLRSIMFNRTMEWAKQKEGKITWELFKSFSKRLKSPQN